MAQKRLGRLESEVMKAVWRLGRGTVRDVLRALDSDPPRAYTTVLTTLRNLEAKGYLRHEVEGRTHVYLPLVAEGAVGKRAVRDLLDRLFDGSPVRLVQALLESEALTAEELALLRRAVDERRGEEGGNV